MTGPITRGTIRTSVVLGLRLLVQAGTLLLVARLLGPDQFGAFTGLAALAVLLGTLSTFGTHVVLLGEVSKDPGQGRKVLRYAIPCTLLCGALLLLLYLWVGTCLLGDVHIPVLILLAIGVSEMVLQPLFALMTSEQHALGRVAYAQLLQLLPMGLRLFFAGLVLLAASPAGLFFYALGYVLASVLALAYGWMALPSCWPSWRSWCLPNRAQWRHALGYAATNITRTAPAELDKALALKLLPVATVGLYSAAARVIGAATLPIAAMALAALPRLFREGQQSQSGRRLLVWMYVAALIYSTLLAGVLWLAAPLFDAVFGIEYIGVSELIRLMCAAVPGMALRQVAGNVLMAAGKPWMRVGFEGSGLLILVICSLGLTGELGVSGLPVAVICAEWGMAALGLAMIVYVRYAEGTK
ncbi:oligosaccharide flippase family protein [Stenotrophomonas sp.]|uniref:oligosaccharide flippase family protein n=1 Tax=Stenotrophomonas sp. TaxID=69392 RepID=UPI0028A73789|nr:oligosaccharide flippase family protein [Stenotrophomonas sp.]